MPRHASALSAVIFDGGHGLRKWIKGCCLPSQLTCNDRSDSRSHPDTKIKRHAAKTSAISTEPQACIYQGCCLPSQLTCNDRSDSRSHPDTKIKRHAAKTSAISTEPQACIYQEAYAQTTPPGAQIAEPRCRRLVTCCSPGSLLTESKLFAEVLDLPMTHAATDPRGFTASRRRALSSSACTLPGSYHCKQLARLCHVRLCTAGFHQSRAADGLRAAYTRVP